LAKSIFAFGLVLLIFGGLLALVGTSYGPDLLTDYRLKDQRLVVDHSLRVERTRCNSRTIVVSFCTIYYSSAATRAAARGRTAQLELATLSYMLLGTARPRNVDLLHAASDRNTLVLSFGLEQFGNRLAAFALIVGALLAFLTFLIVKAVRSDRAGWQLIGATY
jgi:hypothetical protein